MAQGKFKKSILDNGMTLVTESVPHFKTLSIGVWVAAGTRHEARGEEGLSHFLEHMMFKGTEKRSAIDIALEVDRVGGEFNAFTAREYTCFHILLLARDVRLAVELLSDVLLNSRFAREEIERERKVILQEISMTEDNPEEFVHDLFFEQALGGHPLGKPILGTRKRIAAVDRDTIVSYFRRHYCPKQMIVSVSGDVSHTEVRKHLNRALARGRLTSGAARKNMGRPRLAAGTRNIYRNLEQAHLVAGFPGPAYNDRERFAAYLLNIYLGGGMSSSLFQEIREKRGLAYNVYSMLAPFSDCGLFSVYAATTPGEAGTCLTVMGKECAKLASKPLDENVLDILKENLRSSILMNADSVESRMTAIAKGQMFFGRYLPIADITRAIERVSAKDVHRFAKKCFRRKNLIQTFLGPRSIAKAARNLARELD